MSGSRLSRELKLLLDDQGQQPPPGIIWRMAHVLLIKESDDIGISAVVLNLPGCASQGDTIEEAMANVKEAIEGVLEVYWDHKEVPPWRNSREDEIPPFSEQRWIQVEERK
jgi:predicted RNase H-like HicB family nuclease